MSPFTKDEVLQHRQALQIQQQRQSELLEYIVAIGDPKVRNFVVVVLSHALFVIKYVNCIDKLTTVVCSLGKAMSAKLLV